MKFDDMKLRSIAIIAVMLTIIACLVVHRAVAQGMSDASDIVATIGVLLAAVVTIVGLTWIASRWRGSETEAALEALRRSEDQLRLILDSAAEAIYGTDLEGNCTFCNTACVCLLGYSSPDELVGKNMHSQIHHSHKDGSPFPEAECPIHLSLWKEGVSMFTTKCSGVPTAPVFRWSSGHIPNSATAKSSALW